MKDNFKILNNVDIDLDKYQDLNIDKDKLKQQMRKKIKSKNKFKKNIAIAASVCIVSFGLISAGIINPSLADGIPIIENIFEDLNETLSFDGVYTKYAQGIGQTQTVNGTTVSIEEAVSDGHNLYLTYKIKSNEKLPRGEFKPYGENSGDLMLYKDIKIDNGGSLIGGTSLVGYYRDDYTFVGMESYQIEFKGKEVPRNFNAKIKIESIGDVNSHLGVMIKGPFKFYLDIESKTDLDLIEINESKDGYKVKNIEVSPYRINVNIEFPEAFVSDRPDIVRQVSINDNKGETIASRSYDENGIKVNKTRIENNTVYDTISFNYRDAGYDCKPDYIIVKFKDFYQSQEPIDIYTSEDGSTTEFTLPDPQEIKETKDVEFKIDLKKLQVNELN